MHYYHLSTKLREGNAFSCVCLSFCLSTGGGQGPFNPHDCTPPPNLYRTLSPPRHVQLVQFGIHCTGTPPYGRVQTCSTWTSLYRGPLLLDMFKLVHYKTRTVGEWTVDIRLKYLLLSTVLASHFPNTSKDSCPRINRTNRFYYEKGSNCDNRI